METETMLLGNLCLKAFWSSVNPQPPSKVTFGFRFSFKSTVALANGSANANSLWKCLNIYYIKY